MGKKYEKYEQLAKAETEAWANAVAAEAAGELSAIRSAEARLHEVAAEANKAWKDLLEDPQG